MPRGPNGEKRPADVVSCAVTVARIATGEDEEAGYRQPNRRVGGKIGGKARSEVLTGEERSAIAKRGASVRWEKSP